MSIQVNSICKTYGNQKSLDKVSFEIGSNEIVGFLGPNGAGKSTMMKILTCFIPPTSGQAKVFGFDIINESIEVRKQIGYLPEHNPLYLDMYVKEFLEFVGGLHQISKIKNMVPMNRSSNKIKNRVKEMIEVTGLQAEQTKKIGALSKGYRQRVGLAQAMIHNPKVLILDEPTTGLDPNQLEDIRFLIKNLGKEKTVMLSTHIMQEVEAICDKVIIINQGIIVANDETKNLQKNNIKQIITVEFDKNISIQLLQSIPHINQSIHLHDNTWQLISNSKNDIRKDIFDFAVSNQLSVLTLNKEEQKMEDVFKQFTSKKS